jgi:peroxiredoxin
MSTAAKSSTAADAKPWWAYRRNRNKVWLGLVAVGAIVLVAGWFWLNSRGTSMQPEAAVPVGKQVSAVKLEDSRTGQMFDLGQYLGKKDIVLVAYMGEFCPGCSELVGELQRRSSEFDAADAQLVVLGYEVGQTGRDTAAKHGVTSYPLLQEGEPNTFTKSIGMWSDMMGMPWMGYVIIDKTGKIVSGEQMGLSEARGAASRNIDKLLAALSAPRAQADARAADEHEGEWLERLLPWD